MQCNGEPREPRRQEGIPAQPVHVVTCRAAEKVVQSPACNPVLERGWLRSTVAALVGVSEKWTSLGPALGSAIAVQLLLSSSHLEIISIKVSERFGGSSKS